jgi:hypothetical protein
MSIFIRNPWVFLKLKKKDNKIILLKMGIGGGGGNI